LALKLASLNSTVVCLDVQTAEQEVVSKNIVEGGKSAFYFQCDVTDKNQVEQTIESIKNEIGEITMLYHCCSLPSPRSINVQETPSVKETFDLSVTSYFYVSFIRAFSCTLIGK
jgi:all-trans-retinol dehydrogenase (NAD+)